jgi:hypothetical protein
LNKDADLFHVDVSPEEEDGNEAQFGRYSWTNEFKPERARGVEYMKY